MIVNIATQPQRAADLPGLAQTPTGDPFAALFAAFAPIEDAPPIPDDTDAEPIAGAADEARSMLSPEDLLALVAPAAAAAAKIAPMMEDLPIVPPAARKVAQPLQAPGEAGNMGPAPLPHRATLIAAPADDFAAEKQFGRGDARAQLPQTSPTHAAALLQTPKLPPMATMPPGAEQGPVPVPRSEQVSFVAGPDQAGAMPPPIVQAVTQAVQTMAPPPVPTNVTAAAMAQQLAAALPRLRQTGEETVLTLDPARLGRVTLSWQSGKGGVSLLTVRAVEPTTAALLTRLGDDMTALLRADPALTVGPGGDWRIDIARGERAPETRLYEQRQLETAQVAGARDLASDTGQARQQDRAPPSPISQPQTFGPHAVNPDDPADPAALPPGRGDPRARLA